LGLGIGLGLGLGLGLGIGIGLGSGFDYFSPIKPPKLVHGESSVRKKIRARIRRGACSYWIGLCGLAYTFKTSSLL